MPAAQRGKVVQLQLALRPAQAKVFHVEIDGLVLGDAEDQLVEAAERAVAGGVEERQSLRRQRCFPPNARRDQPRRVRKRLAGRPHQQQVGLFRRAVVIAQPVQQRRIMMLEIEDRAELVLVGVEAAGVEFGDDEGAARPARRGENQLVPCDNVARFAAIGDAAGGGDGPRLDAAVAPLGGQTEGVGAGHCVDRLGRRAAVAAGRLEHPHRRPTIRAVMRRRPGPLESGDPGAPGMEHAPLGVAAVAVFGHGPRGADLREESHEHVTRVRSCPAAISSWRSRPSARRKRYVRAMPLYAAAFSVMSCNCRHCWKTFWASLRHAAGLGQFGKRFRRPGKPRRPGEGLVERPFLLGEERLRGEAAKTSLELLVQLPPGAEHAVGVDDRIGGKEVHPPPRLARLPLNLPHVQQGDQPLLGFLAVLSPSGPLAEPGQHGRFLAVLPQRFLRGAIDKIRPVARHGQGDVTPHAGEIVGFSGGKRNGD